MNPAAGATATFSPEMAELDITRGLEPLVAVLLQAAADDAIDNRRVGCAAEKAESSGGSSCRAGGVVPLGCGGVQRGVSPGSVQPFITRGIVARTGRLRADVRSGSREVLMNAAPRLTKRKMMMPASLFDFPSSNRPDAQNTNRSRSVILRV
jgi:hypothetical protein